MRLGLDLRIAYYTRGGIARYARRLAQALPALAPAHEHVHFYRRGHAETYATGARRVNCWTPAHHRLERLAMSVEVSPHRPDVLHSPDFIPPLGGYRRSVITVHDLAFLLYPDFLTSDSRRYYNGQIRWAAQRADAIACVSQATRADLMERLGVAAEKIQVIYHGLDPEFMPLDGKAIAPVLNRLGLSAGYLLFVGTFEPRKNVTGLLRAYAGLRARAPDVPPLVLAGRRGWLFEDARRALDDLPLAEHVVFVDDPLESDLPALYSGAGLLVLVSHYEGFGLPVLEAMGCGTPCVIADRSALPEIAGEAAVRVDPDEPDSIADGLLRVLGHSGLRAELRGRGLERARQFTWERAGRETLALYQSVA